MSVIMSLISVYALYYCTWQEGHSYKTHASNVTLVTTILLRVFVFLACRLPGARNSHHG